MNNTLKILLLLALVTLFNDSSFAQIKDPQVEAMMTHRILTCDDIYYNSITLIPQLYRAKKADTADAVNEYWQKNCGMTEASVAFAILHAIEKRTFWEGLNNVYKSPGRGSKPVQEEYYKSNIIGYLNSNYDFFNIQYEPWQYKTFYYSAYVEYSNFIRSMAGSLLDMKGLSPVEHFLVDYYADPSPFKLTRLTDSVYNGTLIQQAYKKGREFGGFSYGMSVGQWHPLGNLSILGDHVTTGCFIGGRSKGFWFNIPVGLSFGNSPNYYYTKNGDSVYNTNHFFGYLIGLDFGQALYRTRRTELAVIAGMAYEGAEVLYIQDETGNKKDILKNINTLNLNGGLEYKLYLRHVRKTDKYLDSYLALQARYNLVNYKNTGGTDLSGNTVTFSLIWGGYSRSYQKKKFGQ